MTNTVTRVESEVGFWEDSIDSRTGEPQRVFFANSTKHVQVRCMTPGGYEVGIDEDLSKFIPHLWKEGYVTSFSCQANGLRGINYIMFTTRQDAVRFCFEYSGQLDPFHFGGGWAVESFEIPEEFRL